MLKPIYFIRSVNVLNCLLLAAVVLAADQFIVPYLNLKVRAVLPAIGAIKTETSVPQLLPPKPALADYNVLSEKNLFNPQRKIPVEKKAGGVAVLPKPDLVLYGTLISDDLNIAYIEDRKAPYMTPGRGQRQKVLRKGESINGFVLKDIEPNRIVLERGKEKLVVMLEDKSKQRVGAAAATAAVIPAKGALAVPSQGSASAISAGSVRPPATATPPVKPSESYSPATTRRPYNIQDLLKLKQPGQQPAMNQPPSGQQGN